MVGYSPEAATSTLKEAGLTVVNRIDQPVQDPSQINTVVDTSIEAGRKVEVGSSVTLFVGVAPEPTLTPTPTQPAQPTEVEEPADRAGA